METRKPQQSKFSELPADYLKMVTDVFSTNFSDGLTQLKKLSSGKVHFAARGRVFPDEIVFSISLLCEGQLAATTVYASVDYDPRASAPTIQDLLSACVDATGAIFGPLFSKPEGLLSQSLSALEKVPFQWTEIKIDRYKVHAKIDKANPALDEMAENWLETHDPKLKRTRD